MKTLSNLVDRTCSTYLWVWLFGMWINLIFKITVTSTVLVGCMCDFEYLAELKVLISFTWDSKQATVSNI